jgi:hypothetical protein
MLTPKNEERIPRRTAVLIRRASNVTNLHFQLSPRDIEDVHAETVKAPVLRLDSPWGDSLPSLHLVDSPSCGLVFMTGRARVRNSVLVRHRRTDESKGAAAHVLVRYVCSIFGM